MSLRPCHECGKEISTSAGKCPYCGARHDYGGYAWMAVLAAIVAVIIMMINTCSTGKPL